MQARLVRGNSIGTITINGNYLQTSTGLLDMEFTANGSRDQLIVNGDAELNGRQQFRPIKDYYRSNLNLLLQDVVKVQGTSSGSFASTSLLNNSPTLSMALESIGNDYRIFVSRAANAYSQYAGSSYNGGQVGSTLYAIAGVAEGDMQNLFVALDFSSAGNIHNALPQLSPVVYDAASRASIDNNRMISSLLSGNMLKVAQDNEKQPSGDGKVFVIPFASTAQQSNSTDVTGYNNKGVGIIGGVEKYWESGLKAGVHAVFSHNEFDAKTFAGAKNKVDGMQLGVHGLFKPDLSGGWYTFGQLRAGVENNDMERKVSFEGLFSYQRKRLAVFYWGGFCGGGGYDMVFGPVTVGPTANLDYALTNRPAITETSGAATRLRVDSSNMQSLDSNLGAKMAFTTTMESGSTFVFDIAATWQHELLDGTQNSVANFVGYSNERFRSQDKLSGRDSMKLQGGVSVIATDNFSVSTQAGGEFLRSGYSSAYGDLSFEYNF